MENLDNALNLYKLNRKEYTEEDLKIIRKKLLKQHHPDLHPNDEQAGIITKKILEGFVILLEDIGVKPNRSSTLIEGSEIVLEHLKLIDKLKKVCALKKNFKQYPICIAFLLANILCKIGEFEQKAFSSMQELNDYYTSLLKNINRMFEELVLDYGENNFISIDIKMVLPHFSSIGELFETLENLKHSKVDAIFEKYVDKAQIYEYESLKNLHNWAYNYTLDPAHIYDDFYDETDFTEYIEEKIKEIMKRENIPLCTKRHIYTK